MYNTHTINKKTLIILENFHLKLVYLKFFARPRANSKEEFQLFVFSSVLLKIEGNSITLQVTQEDHINFDEYEIYKDCFISCSHGEKIYKFSAQLIDHYNISNKNFVIFSSIIEANEFEEQRNFPRLNIHTPLTYWIEIPTYNEKMSSGVLIDISEGGLQFSSSLKLNENLPVGVQFTLPTFGQLSAKGNIRWCLETTNSIYHGIEFTEINLTDRIKINLLVKNIINSLN